MRVFSCLCRLCLCLCLCVFLASCADPTPPARLFAYADGDFSATVRGRLIRLFPDGYTGAPSLVGEGYTGVPRPFAATLSVRRDGRGGSTMSVTYAEPPALAGMTVTRARSPEGTVTVTLTRSEDGGSPLTLDLSGVKPARVDALLSPLLVLMPTGDVVSVTPATEKTTTVTRRDVHGVTVAYTFADGRALPISVVWESPDQRGEISVS